MKHIVSVTAFFGLLNQVFGFVIPGGLNISQEATALHARVAELATADMKWMGIVTDGGDVTTLYGQASDVYQQILVINPTYKAEKYSTEDIATSTLIKRDLVTCYEGFSGAEYGANDNAVQGCIQILNLMGGLCHVPAQSCTMLECQRYSGIGGGVYACNNATEDFQTPCSNFGSYATAIVDSCVAVEYSLPNGNKFNLHDGVYTLTEGRSTIIQRCAS